MSSQQEEPRELDDDFYAILNVPKDASADEIKSAYKRACMLYHPDKHTDPELQAQARDTFPKIQKAYSVLSDEQKRAIYDVYGEQGLSAGFELAPYYNTTAELKAEYELQKRRQEEERLMSQANAQGKMVVSLDATPLFSERDDEYAEFEADPWWTMFTEIGIASMSIQQSIETSITDRDTMTLSGAMVSRDGNGGGNLSGTWQRNWDGRAQTDLSLGIGSSGFLHVKASKVIDQGSHAFVEVSANQVKNGMMASLGAGVTQILAPHTQGMLRWSAGMDSLMATSIHYNTQDTSASLTFQLGLPNTHIAGSFSRQLTESIRGRASLKVGLVGWSFSYGVERDLGEKRSVGVALNAGSKGVEVRWKYVRASQTYMLPIMLADELAVQPVIYGTLIPVFIVAAVNHLVIQPYLKSEEVKRLKQQRRRYAALIAKRKLEAQAAIRLMQETVDRKIRAEESVGGLVIVQAWYGKLVAAGDADDEAPVIDVRVPLQCLVKDSQLRLQGISKSNLVGFYDPCIDETKSLKVSYKFKGQMHEVTIDDKEELKIPLKKHLIQ